MRRVGVLAAFALAGCNFYDLGRPTQRFVSGDGKTAVIQGAVQGERRIFRHTLNVIDLATARAAHRATPYGTVVAYDPRRDVVWFVVETWGSHAPTRQPFRPDYGLFRDDVRVGSEGLVGIAADGDIVELPTDVRGVLFGGVAVRREDADAPLRLHDVSTDRTVTLEPGWTEARLLETPTSRRHRRGDPRRIEACAIIAGRLVARQLDVDAAFAAGRDTTVTTPLALDGGSATCAFSTDGARVAVIDPVHARVAIVDLDGSLPPRRVSGRYRDVVFAGSTTVVASGRSGVDLITAQTGWVRGTLEACVPEVSGPDVVCERPYRDGGRTTDRIDEFGRTNPPARESLVRSSALADWLKRNGFTAIARVPGGDGLLVVATTSYGGGDTWIVRGGLARLLDSRWR